MPPNQSADPSPFGVAFTALLDAAGLSVDGVLRSMPGDCRGQVSRSTLYDWKNGQRLPGNPDLLLEVVEVCLHAARQRGVTVTPDDKSGWLRLLDNQVAANAQPAATQLAVAPHATLATQSINHRCRSTYYFGWNCLRWCAAADNRILSRTRRRHSPLRCAMLKEMIAHREQAGGIYS